MASTGTAIRSERAAPPNPSQFPPAGPRPNLPSRSVAHCTFCHEPLSFTSRGSMHGSQAIDSFVTNSAPTAPWNSVARPVQATGISRRCIRAASARPRSSAYQRSAGISDNHPLLNIVLRLYARPGLYGRLMP